MFRYKCRICKSKNLELIFSLGKQPLANNLLTTAQKKTKRHPLDLYQCAHCTLIQLGYVVSKETLYDNYLYIPSVSKTHLRHFVDLSESLIKDLSLRTKSLVVDIGSSDGSFLECFEQKGMRVVGVEPAKNIVTSVATMKAYFTKKIARAIERTEGKAKLITATNVFAHIDDLYEFLECLDILLDDDGVFFAQFPDVRNLFKENQFDTIYHEHLSYFSPESLYHLFMNSPFEISRIDNSKIHGGSMSIYIRRRALLLNKFKENVRKIKQELYEKIVQLKKEGKKIVAYGAAAKGVILLNYVGLDTNLIDFVVDGTSYKIGKYIPGVNIPVLPENELIFASPDVVLILAWNFKEEIIEKLNNIPSNKFTYIVPIPTVEVIS